MLRKRLLSLALTATLTLGAALVPTAAAAAAPAADPAHPIEVGGVAHPDDWAPPGSAAQSRSAAPEALAAVVPPANDDLANATVVSSLPYYSRSPYYGATFEEGESGSAGRPTTTSPSTSRPRSAPSGSPTRPRLDRP